MTFYQVNTHLKLIIHLHFHTRTTGITKSIESIFPLLIKHSDAKIFGFGINLPGINLFSFLRLVFNNEKIVVHAHRNNEIIFALLLRSLGGNFKLFFTRHAESSPSGLSLYLMKKADVLLSLTGSMSQHLPVKNTIVRHGIDTDTFNIGVKKKINGISQENLISVIGRIRPPKGQLVVLKSLAPLLKLNPDWGLMMIGKIDNSKYAREIKSIALKNRISDQVHLIPETREILDYYHASDVVIINSCSEGFSLVCLEALSCGLITVATESAGAHSEIITHGKNGFLFPCGDQESLRNIMSGIINKSIHLDPQEIRQSVLDNWSIEQSALNLLKIYGVCTDIKPNAEVPH